MTRPLFFSSICVFQNSSTAPLSPDSYFPSRETNLFLFFFSVISPSESWRFISINYYLKKSCPSMQIICILSLPGLILYILSILSNLFFSKMFLSHLFFSKRFISALRSLSSFPILLRGTTLRLCELFA